ncbi:MAG: hypothetical protein Q9218_006858, partial [Villophora microphyllina]
MRGSIMRWLLTTAPFLPFAVAAPHNHTAATQELVPRYDYEPGDTLNRTMCFCGNDITLEQTDNDPAAFYNISL